MALLGPGEPLSMYHYENDQEDFLVLAGEALAIVEGEERPLRRWDFLHCPAGTNHTILGAGEAPCLVLSVGARDRSTGQDWGAYTVDETAQRHRAGVDRETTEPPEAYARFPKSELTRYQAGWLTRPGPSVATLAAMSKVCSVCGKKPSFGNSRSHSMVATRRGSSRTCSTFASS